MRVFIACSTAFLFAGCATVNEPPNRPQSEIQNQLLQDQAAVPGESFAARKTRMDTTLKERIASKKDEYKSSHGTWIWLSTGGIVFGAWGAAVHAVAPSMSALGGVIASVLTLGKFQDDAVLAEKCIDGMLSAQAEVIKATNNAQLDAAWDKAFLSCKAPGQ